MSGSLTVSDAHLQEAHCSTSGSGQELPQLRGHHQCQEHGGSVVSLLPPEAEAEETAQEQNDCSTRPGLKSQNHRTPEDKDLKEPG